MTISAAERSIRARFPLIRFMQAYMPLSVSRWLLRLSVSRLQLDPDVRREKVLADGVPCEWLITQNASPGQVLLYLHGGGFVLGITHLHIQMVATLAKMMAVRALMVDYRLGPEHPYPAALDDCVAAYRWLLKQGVRAQDIVLAGDSAGGNLALTSLLKLRDSVDPLPAAVACLSPVADFSDSTLPPPGFKDPLIPARVGRFYRDAYLGGHDAHDALVSPIFADLHGLPPLLVHAGEGELLHYDALRITELAKASEVEARVEIYPRMFHVWQIYLEMPEALQSLEDIAGFLNAHMRAAKTQPNPC